MTAVEGERAVGPLIDDEAAASPHEPSPLPADQDAPPASGVVEARKGVAVPPAEDGAGMPAEDAAGEQVDTSGAEPGEPSPGAAVEPAEPSSSEAVAPAVPPPGEAAAERDQPSARRRHRVRVVVGGLLLALLLTVGGGVVGAVTVLALRPQAPPPPPPPAPTGLVAAVDAVAPAVLRIQAGAPDTGTAGTALVVTPTGDVVTNEHLVHGESAATLIAPDGRTSTARVVAADEAADVAWLRIDGAQGLPVVRLAGPAAVRPGEDVVAIGNALNLDGPPSITRGIVSAVGRSTATLTDVIQTDAAISSGSSGGALVDRSGTVVGVTTEALVGDPSVSVEDIAFAIPADRVVAVLRGMGLVLPGR